MSNQAISGTQCNGTSICYDANGNMTSDGVGNVYTWNADGKLATVNGLAVTYDALGREVESPVGVELLYAPTGEKIARLNGQTINKTRIGLPGGGFAEYSSTTLANFDHPDWLGNTRVMTNVVTRGLTHQTEYTPFGVAYDGGTGGVGNMDFNGSFMDTLTGQAGLYDTVYRSQSGAQGRFLQPDPAGLAAVDMSDPQTWNRYAYVGNNPLSYVDPLGLNKTPCWSDGSCVWGGGDSWNCTSDGVMTNCSSAWLQAQSGAAFIVVPVILPPGNWVPAGGDFLGEGCFRGGADGDTVVCPPVNLPTPPSFGPALNPATGVIRAGDPNAKKNYCKHQSNMAALEALLPGGSVFLGGDYSPTAVVGEAGQEALGEALDAGAKSASFLSMVRSWTGIPMSVTSKFLTFAGYAKTAVDLYGAMTAMQKEYAACMQ